MLPPYHWHSVYTLFKKDLEENNWCVLSGGTIHLPELIKINRKWYHNEEIREAVYGVPPNPYYARLVLECFKQTGKWDKAIPSLNKCQDEFIDLSNYLIHMDSTTRSLRSFDPRVNRGKVSKTQRTRRRRNYKKK